MDKRFVIGFCVLVVFVAGFMLFGSSSDDQAATPSESIRVSGAFALYPMMVKWADEYQKIHSNVKIEVSAGGAGKGMADALSNLVEIGMVSREIDPSEVAQGAFFVAVTKDAVVPTMNKGNQYADDIRKNGVRKGQFKEVFVYGNLTKWGTLVGKQGADDKISLYTRADSCGAGDVWAKFMGAKQEDLKGVGVNADPGIADAVSRDRNGMGYNNIAFAYDDKSGTPVGDLMIIPIDINADGTISNDEYFYDSKQDVLQAILSGKYPSPPARDLYIVGKGSFKGATKDFVSWVLTDGQKYVPEAGYIPLTDEKLRAQITKLG
jgi:phosphate transport system substrate-binding protein